jgi:hypothetical protein
MADGGREERMGGAELVADVAAPNVDVVVAGLCARGLGFVCRV